MNEAARTGLGLLVLVVVASVVPLVDGVRQARMVRLLAAVPFLPIAAAER